MAGRTSSLEQLQGIIIIINNNSNVMDYRIPIYDLVYWIFGPSILGPFWRNMTTEYSSPYKVGLIDVGTEFAQSRPLGLQ